MKTVVIDAGCGRKKNGAGNGEKPANEQWAKAVRSQLLERYNVKVVLIDLNSDKRLRGGRRQQADGYCRLQLRKDQGGIRFSVIPPSRRSRRRKRTVHMAAECPRPPNKQALARDAAAVADKIAGVLSLPAVGHPLYRVFAESFQTKEAASDRAKFLKQQQVRAFVEEAVTGENVVYRVDAGRFSERRQAEKRLQELKKMGIGHPFILVSSRTEKMEPILGPSFLSAAQLDIYARHVNDEAPQLGRHYIAFGNHYGVRADIAFAQALLETDDFGFKGEVDPEQNNYCRLCAQKTQPSGASFPTPQDGVLAHIQHLYALAANKPPPEGFPLVDPCPPARTGRYAVWNTLVREHRFDQPYGTAVLLQYEKMKQYSLRQKYTRSSRSILRRFLDWWK